MFIKCFHTWKFSPSSRKFTENILPQSSNFWFVLPQLSNQPSLSYSSIINSFDGFFFWQGEVPSEVPASNCNKRRKMLGVQNSDVLSLKQNAIADRQAAKCFQQIEWAIKHVLCPCLSKSHVNLCSY